MDALLDCVNLLDADGYREALEAAARSFREQQVAPEVVRKFGIHLMYRIFALAPGAEAAGEEGGVALGVEVSEIQQAMTPERAAQPPMVLRREGHRSAGA